ncbi:hypothetical protein ACFSR9_03780 [Deinococcus taklimakanensis]|uniref:Uncharacterized protein n=1 Tax=Deinococcus taklimakanensis TaxID=536443 RepID=A0ABW5NZR5_9DEIO
MKRLALTALLACLPCAGALTQVAPGIYNQVKKDPMTDANLGAVFIREVNDRDINTLFLLKCDGTGGYDFYLMTKNPLMTQADFDLEATPDLMYRIDTQTARTLSTSTVFTDDDPDLTSLSFSATGDRTLFDAFWVARNKVTVRVLRRGMSALDYVFPAKGFIEAYRKIGRCR